MRSVNFVVEDAKERLQENFNENINDFIESVDEKMKSFEQDIDEDIDSQRNTLPEEEIKSMFYKELVDYLGRNFREDFYTLAENYCLDDVVNDIIEEYYDSFSVLYGVGR